MLLSNRLRFFRSLFTLLVLAAMLTLAGKQAVAQAPVPQDTPTPTKKEPTPTKQEKDNTQDLTSLSLEDLMKIKVNSVYSASRFLQKVTEAPASVSIITAEDIKRYGYTTLAAAIRSVRGFYVNYTRTFSELGARGFARPGDFNTRVLLLVDGHRVSDNIYNTALIGSEFPVDVDLIDRIEIIRGPSSSLYGTNAFFGVINVITKRGEDIGGVEVSTQRASFDTYRGRVSYGEQFDSGLDVIVSATLSDSKGPARLYFKEFDSPTTNNGFAENADGEEFRQLFGNLSWREFSLRAVHATRQKNIPTAAFGTLFNDPDTSIKEARGYIDFNYNKIVGQSTELMGRLYLDDYDLEGTNVYSLPSASGNVRTIGKYFSNGLWWGAEATVTTNISSRSKVTGGAEFRNNLKQDERSYFEDPFVPRLDSHHSSRERAGYGEGQFRLSRNLLLNGGVRYDHSNVFGGSTNPRFALVYNPLEKTTLKVLYGQAFRAPNVYEVYVHSSGESRSNVGPERIKTAEVVLEQYFGDRVRVAASAFSYRIKNLISQVTDPESGLQTFVNVGRVSSNGFESEAELKTNLGLQGLFSYAYQSSRDSDSGQKLTNSPAHMLKLNLNGPIGIKQTFAGLEMQYLGDRRTLANRTAESFLITNLTLLSEQIKNRFDVSCSIYNLFDKKYANPGSAEHRQDVIPQDGRTFRLKFTYRFSGR